MSRLPLRALVPFSILVCVLTSAAYAAVPYQVLDLKTLPDMTVGSDPTYVQHTLGDVSIFLVKVQGVYGALWRSDGTPAGTYELIDLRGARELGFGGSVMMGDRLHLSLMDRDGWKIWATDGTRSGTFPLTPARLTASTLLGVVGDKTFMLNSGPRDLWVRDSSGERILATLRVGTDGWTSVAVWENNFYIGTEDALWKSDGTKNGTKKILSLPSFSPHVVNGRLLFAASDASGAELWTSNGTEAGTHIVADLTPGPASTFAVGRSSFGVMNDELLFLGMNGEIGRSDGTAGGTTVIRTGSPPPAATAPKLTILNGTAYFAFNDGQHGLELWRTDGTAAGTRMVRDASKGNSPVFPISAGATRLFFYGESDGRIEVFQSDGTEAGTHTIGFQRGPGWRGSGTSAQTLATVGDTVFFSADDGHGSEPWASDGTAAGTRMLANIGVDVVGSSHPDRLVVAGDRLYFSAMADTGPSTWSTDGTASGIRAIAEAELQDDLPRPLSAHGNAVFLRSGSQLWRSDGASTAVMVRNFTIRGHIQQAFSIAGRFYVIADDGNGAQVWAADSTGTVFTRLTQLFGRPTPLVSLAGQAYFADLDDATVYATDGTIETTRSVARPSDDGSGLAPIPFRGGLLQFVRKDSSGAVLQQLSGAAAHITEVRQGTWSEFSAAIGTVLLFVVRKGDLDARIELWRTDGTSGGTTQVTEIPILDRFGDTSMVALGSRVVFWLKDRVYGYEPWVSDGTAHGTKMLRDINTTGSSFVSSSLLVADGIGYFTATNPEHGAELWRTDGTPEGTMLVVDLEPGPVSSRPSSIVRMGNALYFAATTVATGTELWALPLPDAPAVTIDDARASENRGVVSIPVRLTRASSRTVTVAFETANGTAEAGRHYFSASGQLTFLPGETVKMLTFSIVNDGIPATTRAFDVKLKDANAPIERTAGAAIIEDDDVITDLSVTVLGNLNAPLVRVRNAGPSAASNVRLCYAAPPLALALSCLAPVEVAAGAEFTHMVNSSGGIVAKVTQWEWDANPENNTVTAGVRGVGSSGIAITPSVLRAGETGVISIGRRRNVGTTVGFSSSDPTVVRVPATLRIPDGEHYGAVHFDALKPGRAVITADFDGYRGDVIVYVLGSSEPVRSPVQVTIQSFSAWEFNKANSFSAGVTGVTPDGLTPTGSVIFRIDGKEVGTAPLVNHRATLLVTTTELGPRVLTATYTGDARFLGESSVDKTNVIRGFPAFSAGAIPGTNDVVIKLRGIDGFVPSGTISVLENGIAPRTVGGPLAKTSPDAASATAAGFSPDARSVTITYSGDPYWNNTTVTIPIGRPRNRAVRH